MYEIPSMNAMLNGTMDRFFFDLAQNLLQLLSHLLTIIGQLSQLAMIIFYTITSILTHILWLLPKFQILTYNTIAQLNLKSYYYRKNIMPSTHRNMTHKDIHIIPSPKIGFVQMKSKIGRGKIKIKKMRGKSWCRKNQR